MAERDYFYLKFLRQSTALQIGQLLPQLLLPLGVSSSFIPLPDAVLFLSLCFDAAIRQPVNDMAVRDLGIHARPLQTCFLRDLSHSQFRGMKLLYFSRSGG